MKREVKMAKSIHKLLEDQVKTWELENLLDNKLRTPKGDPYPVITISREFGARGAALASLIGEKTGFQVWDKDILQNIANKLGSSQKYLSSVDENRRDLFGDVVLGFMKNVNTNVNYLRSLNRLIRTIEQHGNAVIVGRGSNYICRKPQSLHVRVVSPLYKRAEGYAYREELTRNEAEAMIRKIDKERAEFVRYHFGKDVSTPSDYDLVLNSGIYSLEQMLQIITESYKQKNNLKLDAVAV